MFILTILTSSQASRVTIIVIQEAEPGLEVFGGGDLLY